MPGPHTGYYRDFWVGFFSGLLVSPPPPDTCPADIDGDDSVGILDFLFVLAGWDTDPGGPPDFDGDGNVGINDLLELLGNWGPCR